MLLTVCPPVPALTVAVIVIVVLAPGASEPFQPTVLPECDVDPDVAVDPAYVTCDGNASVNSSPGLSCCVPLPLFVITTVYVTVPPGANVPETDLVALTSEGE